MTDFIFHRQPRAHQLRDFERFKDAPYFALFYDPRVGKTKVTLDIFRYRYERGDVDALIVISYPSGVKYVWEEEAGKEFPPEFLKSALVIVWQAGKTTSGERRVRALQARDHKGPVVISLNCESLRLDHCIKYLDEWIGRKRRVMLVADESSFAANYSKQTQRLLLLGGFHKPRPNVIIKAILDGTPVDESPIELYHPATFLRRGLLGFSEKAAFRAHHEMYEEEEIVDEETGALIRRRVVKTNRRTGANYSIFKGYRHTEELTAKMATFGSRVRRSDVSDAPPKVYQSVFFEMTPKARAVYEKLRDEYIAELANKYITVDQVLKRMTRLQQVARNYYPPEPTAEPCSGCFGAGFTENDTDCEVCAGLGAIIRPGELHRIDKQNPALDALVTAVDGPTVIWCRFRQDAEDSHAALRSKGRTAFLYSGAVPEREREDAYRRFKAGEGDDIVATLASGLGRGKDLSRARSLIYYSNEFSLRMRRQSEDRAEGIMREVSTDIIDIVAADTRDLDVITALRAKRSLAEAVMGDPPSRWL